MEKKVKYCKKKEKNVIVHIAVENFREKQFLFQIYQISRF